MTAPKHSTVVLMLAVALAYMLGSWPTPTAHADDAAIVRVLERIARALERGNR